MVGMEYRKPTKLLSPRSLFGYRMISKTFQNQPPLVSARSLAVLSSDNSGFSVLLGETRLLNVILLPFSPGDPQWHQTTYGK